MASCEPLDGLRVLSVCTIGIAVFRCGNAVFADIAGAWLALGPACTPYAAVSLPGY